METKQSSHEDAKSAEEGKKAAEEDHLDEQVAEQKTVKTLTAKEIKIIRKPEF
jgi:DNA-binding transcriptional regulator YiaG